MCRRGPENGAADPPGHLCEAALTKKVQRKKLKLEPHNGVTAGAFELIRSEFYQNKMCCFFIRMSQWFSHLL